MEDYQNRVIVEKTELDEKIVALTKFIYSDDSVKINYVDFNLLDTQLDTMMDYSCILKDRISTF